jgi:predicted ATPase
MPVGRPPLVLTRLIGRDELLATIDDRLVAHRLVTLVGAGGAGKTRLAVEVLARAERDAALVELAGVSHPEQVDPLVSDVLAAGDERPALVVLDNCEHVARAAAEVSAALLATNSEMRVLATSRTALGVAGEVVVAVPPLDLPPPGVDDPEQLAGYGAVALAVERAAEHDAGFRLTAENASAIAAMCRAVGGLPLAVEIAAAQLRAVTPQEATDKLRDRMLRLRAPGSRDDRRRTLEDVLRWSYELLDPHAQALLPRLGIFSGGFTLDAVEYVCGGFAGPDVDVYDVLLELVDHSLVQRQLGPGPVTRFSLSEPARAFALELLAEIERAPVGAGSEAEPDVEAKTTAWLFVREGDVWGCGNPASPVWLKHAKGMTYIQHLLGASGRDIHVLELTSADAAPSDAMSRSAAREAGLEQGEFRDPVIDSQALAEYRQRFHDLQADLDEARERADFEREAAVRIEMDFLATEISAATGRGGRIRANPAATERARVAATKAIRSAIGRLEDASPTLGHHLRAHISTGTFCRYEPSPSSPVEWRLRRP